MKSKQLQSMLLQLLEPGIYKTTAQLVEEFRMENPSCWKELETEGQTLYGNSCSSIQQPSTRTPRPYWNYHQKVACAIVRAAYIFGVKAEATLVAPADQ